MLPLVKGGRNNEHFEVWERILISHWPIVWGKVLGKVRNHSVCDRKDLVLVEYLLEFIEIRKAVEAAVQFKPLVSVIRV
jgi:hypothetical protein